MPVKVVVDTSEATAVEQQEFLSKHGSTIQNLGTTATASGFEFKYRSVGAAPSQADVYKEMMQSLRYYGGIRYILLPVYLTAMAALVAAYYKDEYQVPNQLITVCGLVASVALLILEWGLSENLRLIWAEVYKIVGDGKVFTGVDPLPQRKRTANLVSTRITFYGIYTAGLLLWLCILFDICRCTLLSR